LAAILYHIILWVKKIITQYIVVLSDFWPHGAVAKKYDVLRSDGVSERALFVIDKKGVIQAIHVSDINIRPDLKWCATKLEKLDKK
jgi:peroxiredoxin (alkyl hydroperoxide reductase subunit C)